MIATVVTLPIIVFLAIVLGDPGGNNGKGGASPTNVAQLPPLTPSAPAPDAAVTAPCTDVLRQLPERLGSLLPRVVHPKPDSLFVVAWGEPAIILRCGVSRPADLKPGSNAQFISASKAGDLGPFYDVTSADHDEIYTTVDRAVYVSISIPSKYSGGEYLPPLSEAIAKALPPVCLPQASVGQTPPPADKLCTHRK